ncbi:MAG: methionine gamma-lyase family protein [Bacilli bacterium]|nr:methionine gamma-lyase family protein [Bacilli bacterium]
MYKDLKIDSELLKLANEAEKELEEIYSRYEANSLLNSAKVLSAFQKFMVSGTDFCEITGYGYSDAGRDKLEQIYADIFKAEDALVRPQIMSGTHALSLTFFGLLKHGDTMISISGTPYDSLKGVIGLEGDSRNSLIANGVKYEEIDLIDNDFDIDAIKTRLAKHDVKLVEIQRSRGYSQRKSLTIEKIERVIKVIREVNKEVIIMIDNCYGDFVEEKEPIEVGADIIVGSLMKNLGGGIAKTGGYIVGNKDLINDVAERFSAPCIGKDIGANMNQNMSFYKGLYLSPAVVCSSLKTMTFASLMLEKLGFDVDPKYDEYRTDVIQTITLNDPDKMVKFCQGIQSACPVESYVSPIPSDMPGYNHQVVMASGSFTEGSTIELSCDGPVIPPYTIFMQGGLTYEYGKLGILLALNKILNK